MPEIRFQAGASVFVPDKADIADATQMAIEDSRERERARGYKWMRLPETLRGTASGSAITLGISKGQSAPGPEQGYAWTLRALIVTGLATGSTPDIVNFYLNDRFSGPIYWQLNGNQFGQTFGRGERILMPGDTLSLQSSGTFASTSLIVVSGEVEEVPAEQLYKVR